VRVLGLDIGERRIGVAVSDPTHRVASPLRVLDAAVVTRPAPLLEIIADYDVGLVVIGLPLSLDATEGPQAKRAREVGTRLAECLGVPVVYADERLSSVEAKRAMSAAAVPDKKKRGRIDMVAASLFLQSYLDATAAEATLNRAPQDSSGRHV